jgi:flagellar hook-associated protein 3 FlgL
MQTYLRGIETQRFATERALESLADNRRVRQASDDPAAAHESLNLRGRAARLEGLQRTAAMARFDLESIEGVLGQVYDVMSSARTKALAGGSTTTDGGAMAEEIEALRGQLMGLSRTHQNGRYLFGGTSTLAPPFDATDSYVGDDAEVQVPLDETATVGSTLSGRRVFLDGGDLPQTLTDLATAMRAGDSAAINALIPVMTQALDHLNAIRADVGGRLQEIEATVDRHAAEGVRVARRLGELEDAGIERVVTQLTSSQTALSALSAGAANVLGRSLFDYLG